MAKKKIQKISVNAMDEYMKRCATTETVEWNGMQVIIKKNLSLEEMIRFVNSVVKSCFDREDGSYLPEVKDFAIRSNIVEMYANFTLPTDLEKQYDMVIRSGAVEMITNYINITQFSELTKSIDAKLQHVADANIEAFTRKLDEVADAFKNLQTGVEKMFDGIDSEDIAKLVGAVANGENMESNIVKAYIKQKKEAEE